MSKADKHRHLRAFRAAMIEAGTYLQLARDEAPTSVEIEDLLDAARIDWNSACECVNEVENLLAALETEESS